jgi:hypothetical protein
MFELRKKKGGDMMWVRSLAAIWLALLVICCAPAAAWATFAKCPGGPVFVNRSINNLAVFVTISAPADAPVIVHWTHSDGSPKGVTVTDTLFGVNACKIGTPRKSTIFREMAGLAFDATLKTSSNLAVAPDINFVYTDTRFTTEMEITNDTEKTIGFRIFSNGTLTFTCSDLDQYGLYVYLEVLR